MSANMFRAVAARQAQRHGFTTHAISAACVELDCSPALESALTPAQLAIEVCHASNSAALDYVEGRDYQPHLKWLPDTHYRATFTHNVAAGLSAKFDALSPYHHDWSTVLIKLIKYLINMLLL